MCIREKIRNTEEVNPKKTVAMVSHCFFSGPIVTQIIGNQGPSNQYLKPTYICGKNETVSINSIKKLPLNTSKPD